MRRWIVVVLTVAVILASSVSAGLARSDTSAIPETALLEPVAVIPVGTGPDAIQVLPSVEGGTPMGPQSLFATPDGRVYVLDSLQSQVLVLDRGRHTETIAVPFSRYPRDILIHNNHLFLLDSNATVYETSLRGELIREYRLPDGMGSLSVYRLAVSNGHVVLWTENYLEVPLSNMPSHLNPRDLGKSSNGRGVRNPDGQHVVGKFGGFTRGEIYSLDGNLKIDVDVQDFFGSMMMTAFDSASNTYVLVEELANGAPVIISEVTLRRYDRKGEMTGVARLPMQDLAAYPNRPVDVSVNGTMHLLIPSSDRVTVYKVLLGRRYNSTLPQLRAESIRRHISGAETQAMATYTGNPQSRGDTRNRAMQMVNYSWTWNPTKNDFFSDGSARNSLLQPRPAQLGTSTSTQNGIPYTMGGWDSLWSRSDSQPWTNFGTSLTYYSNKGPLVGNTGNSWYAGTSGIDCSGFVAAAVANYSFNGTKPGTDSLLTDSLSITDAVGTGSGFISFSGLQPMDMFIRTNSAAHVLMYDWRRLDGTGVWTLESTTSQANISGDSRQAAKVYWRRWTDSVTNEGVSGFTYHRSWWQKVDGDDFDQPLTNTGSFSGVIKGRNMFFRYPYSGGSPTTISVTVTANSGDPDVYVYTYSGNSATLVTKNDGTGGGTVSWTGIPGTTYFVVIHAYSDASFTVSKSW